MNMHTTIKPATFNPCDLPFSAAMTREQMKEVENTGQAFGVNRRIVLLFATLDRSDMTTAIRNLEANESDELTTLELIRTFVEHCETMLELATSIEARAILAYHDALGLSLDDTCPRS